MKRILIAVSGLNPQVITETMYALQQLERLPDSVRVLTTRAGKAALNASLLCRPDGHYYRFLADYGITPDRIDFSGRHIYAVTDEHGTEYDDIAGEEENGRFLALCMEHAFAATGNPDAEVYFSIAGGRKSMGACLAVAAQCYARPCDRLYHVLVSPEFESSPNFYFPPAESRPIELRDCQGNPYFKETRYARVTLAPLPFFSIRERLSANHLRQVESPASLMTALVRERRTELVIDLPRRRISWKGRQADMDPARLAVYAYFAFLKKEAVCGREQCGGCDACMRTVDAISGSDCNIAELYRRHIAPYRDHDAMSATGVLQLDEANFRSYRSKVNRDIEQAFGPYEAASIAIASRGRKPARYGIALDRDRIRIVI